MLDATHIIAFALGCIIVLVFWGRDVVRRKVQWEKLQKERQQEQTELAAVWLELREERQEKVDKRWAEQKASLKAQNTASAVEEEANRPRYF